MHRTEGGTETVMSGQEAIRQLIDTVLKAQQRNDEEAIEAQATQVLSLYLEALRDFHFEESKVDWLNAILSAIDDRDGAALVGILESEEDDSYRFLGTEVATIFAGFREQFPLMTLAQAVGIQALLDED
jgi:hypothetical protein